MTKQELITYITNLDIDSVKAFSLVFVDSNDKQIQTNVAV